MCIRDSLNRVGSFHLKFATGSISVAIMVSLDEKGPMVPNVATAAVETDQPISHFHAPTAETLDRMKVMRDQFDRH